MVSRKGYLLTTLPGIACLALAAALLCLAAWTQPAWAAEQEPLSTGQAQELEGALHAQDESDDTGDAKSDTESASYESPDGLVAIYGMTSGDVSYKRKTRTLTLDSVKADRIAIGQCKTFKLCLKGESNADLEGACELLTVEGAKGGGVGTLIGSAALEGDLEVKKNGALKTACDFEDYYKYDEDDEDYWDGDDEAGAIGLSCSVLTMRGGSVSASCNADAETGTALSCSTLIMRSGSLNVSAKAMAYLLEDDHSYDEADAVGITCDMFEIYSGSVSVSASDNGGYASARAIDCDSIAMRGGKLKTSSGNYGLSCKTLVMTGGLLQASGGTYFETEYGEYWEEDDYYTDFLDEDRPGYGISCTKLTLRGGVISASGKGELGAALKADTLLVNGGKLKANWALGDDLGDKPGSECNAISAGSLSVKGGAIVAKGERFGVSANTLAISKGSLKATGGEASISCERAGVSGGQLVLPKSGGDGLRAKSIGISGGSVAASRQARCGIIAIGGNIKMTGGKVKVVRCGADAVRASRVSGKGGKAQVLGGKLTAQVSKPAKRYAVRAATFKYKNNALKSLKGAMPRGFAFKYGRGLYKCLDGGKVKQVAPAKGRPYNTVKYAGHRYKVK